MLITRGTTMCKSESIRQICGIGIASINNWKFHWNLVCSLHDEKSVNTAFEVYFGISLVPNFNHTLSLITTSCLTLPFSVSVSGICSWLIQWVKLKILVILRDPNGIVKRKWRSKSIWGKRIFELQNIEELIKPLTSLLERKDRNQVENSTKWKKFLLTNRMWQGLVTHSLFALVVMWK